MVERKLIFMAKKNAKPATKVVEEVVEEAVDETVEAVEEVVEEKPVKKIVKGKVFNCGGLNVRKAPSLNAEIVASLAPGTEIIIEDSGNKEWYKTPSGFVMKAYIQKI